MRTLTALLVMSTLLIGCASSPLEGTWVLGSRELPDGSVQQPPAIMGCLTYADGHRNFNVYWEDDQGRPVSISSVAEYAISDTEYRETNLYYRVSGMGEGEQYDMAKHTGVAPVTRSNGRLEFVFPLHDEPHVVFEADRFTATREGAFVDHWRKLD